MNLVVSTTRLTGYETEKESHSRIIWIKRYEKKLKHCFNDNLFMIYTASVFCFIQRSQEGLLVIFSPPHISALFRLCVRNCFLLLWNWCFGLMV